MNETILSTINKNKIDNTVEFLGETNSLITYAAISTAFGVTGGSINSTAQANKWLHFNMDGKELYVSKVVVRNSIAWDALYVRGLVYGTNDNGLHPTGTPTNQYKTITLNGKLYKCRLLKGADENPATVSTVGYDMIGSRQSEWSRLFYPIITNDPNMSSYTGPMLASYTEDDLQMRYINNTVSPGGFNWCQETPTANSTTRVTRGYYGPSRFNWSAISSFANTYGWRACLELIP